MLKKPSDWPQNQREARLSNVLNAVEKFQKQPNYENKEVLLGIINIIDPNQYDNSGLMRITDYEIGLINHLYLQAVIMHLFSLKVFLYKEATETIRIFNMISKSSNFKNSNDINKYLSMLILPMKIFCLALFRIDDLKYRFFIKQAL